MKSNSIKMELCRGVRLRTAVGNLLQEVEVYVSTHRPYIETLKGGDDFEQGTAYGMVKTLKDINKILQKTLRDY